MKKFALLTAAFAFVAIGATAQTTTEKSTLSEATSVETTTADKEVLSEQEIVNKYLNVSAMPADFPKRVENGSEERYRSLVKAWMKDNRHLLKPEYAQKLKDAEMKRKKPTQK